MKTVNSLNRYQAFRWLWRFDPEGRLLWLKAFLRGCDLREDVAINLRDFGVTRCQ